jgi:ribonucleoside-diphosphate reductase alpha chain
LAEETELLEVPPAQGNGNGNGTGHKTATGLREVHSISDAIAHFQQDAPTCPNCGHVAVRNGACYKCLNCGESLGCS